MARLPIDKIKEVLREAASVGFLTLLFVVIVIVLLRLLQFKAISAVLSLLRSEVMAKLIIIQVLVFFLMYFAIDALKPALKIISKTWDIEGDKNSIKAMLYVAMIAFIVMAIVIIFTPTAPKNIVEALLLAPVVIALLYAGSRFYSLASKVY